MSPACRLCGSGSTDTILRERSARVRRDFFHCAECDCVFVPDEFLLSPEAERERYLLHDNDPEHEGYRTFLGNLRDEVVPLLPPGAEGLDYGCGEPAVLIMMLEQAGFRVAGYDLFFRPDRAPLQRAYEFIVCSETAEHFRHPLTEFERLNSLLRPGGILGVMTGMLERWSDLHTWHYRLDPAHICLYSARTMRWIAARFGWSCDLPRRNVAIFTRPGGEGSCSPRP